MSQPLLRDHGLRSLESYNNNQQDDKYFPNVYIGSEEYEQFRTIRLRIKMKKRLERSKKDKMKFKQSDDNKRRKLDKQGGATGMVVDPVSLNHGVFQQQPLSRCPIRVDITTSRHVLVAPNYDWSLMDECEQQKHEKQCVEMRKKFLHGIDKCNVMIVLTGAFHRTVTRQVNDKRQHTINRLHALRHVPKAAIDQINELLGSGNVGKIHLTHFMDVDAETIGDDFLLDVGVNSWQTISEFTTLWKTTQRNDEKITDMTNYLIKNNANVEVQVFDVNSRNTDVNYVEVVEYIKKNKINVIMLVGKHAQWLNRQLHLVGFPKILEDKTLDIRLVCGPAGASIIGQNTGMEIFRRGHTNEPVTSEFDYYNTSKELKLIQPHLTQFVDIHKFSRLITEGYPLSTGMNVIRGNTEQQGQGATMVNLLPRFKEYETELFYHEDFNSFYDVAPPHPRPPPPHPLLFCKNVAISDSMMMHFTPSSSSLPECYCAHELVYQAWGQPGNSFFDGVGEAEDFYLANDIPIDVYHFPEEIKQRVIRIKRENDSEGEQSDDSEGEQSDYEDDGEDPREVKYEDTFAAMDYLRLARRPMDVVRPIVLIPSSSGGGGASPVNMFVFLGLASLTALAAFLPR
jgi:hypothetical protein